MSCDDSADNFFMALKSSIDRAAYDVAAGFKLDGELMIKVCDLDDNSQTDEILASPHPAVLYQLLEVSEDPRDPLWRATFLIGVKTVADSANFQLSKLQSKINRQFSIGNDIAIFNYFSDTNPALAEKIGAGVICDTEVSPQQADMQSGIRLCRVSMRAVRM